MVHGRRGRFSPHSLACARTLLRFGTLLAAIWLAAAALSADSSSGFQTVFLIVFENHSWASIKGNALAPYLNRTLLPMASHAEQYYTYPGIAPSLPNYLWLEMGSAAGIADDHAPQNNHLSRTAHLVTLLNNAGLSWKSYQEDIGGSACPLVDSGLYAVRHNPVVYFDDVTGTNNPNSPYCTAHVRPYTELASDLQNNTVARYNFITPNLCHDMHDCGVDAGDNWLSSEIPKIMNSQAYRSGGVIFITWDEGDGSPIGLIALSPFAKGNGYANSVRYTHSSTLRSIQEIFGVGPLLGDAANAADLSDLFTIPLQPPPPLVITNAASMQAGSVAPGEFVALFGSGLGPATGMGMHLDPVTGQIDTLLGGTRVLFDGVPAPLIYVQDKQINTVVPFAASGAATQMQVEYQGQKRAPLSVPLAAAAPGLFTADASGKGQGAILNEDLSYNSPSNPAPLGSIVVLYGTGAGAGSPGISVSIGGADAQVLYAGQAPTLIAGIIQVNARVPDGIRTGPAVPVTIQVGNAVSQPGVTLAVK